MKTLAEQINALLIQEDIEGLIEAGAPKDEYESEADQITAAINELRPAQFNPENILAIMALLWAKNFNLDENDMALRLPAIKRVVEEITQQKRRLG